MRSQEDDGMHREDGVTISRRDRLIRLQLMLDGWVMMKGKLRCQRMASPGGHEAYSPNKATSKEGERSG